MINNSTQTQVSEDLNDQVLLEIQADRSNIEYFEINPYSIDNDTDLSNLNNTITIKYVQKSDCSGTTDNILVEVFFPQTELPSTSEIMCLDFIGIPLVVSSNNPELQALSIDVMKYESSWEYFNVFNKSSALSSFKVQETSTEITFTDFDKLYYTHENFIKFRFNYTVKFATTQSDFDLYQFFSYLKLYGGNNLDFAKILPNKTSFGAVINETVRIDNEIQILQPDGMGNYYFNSTHQAFFESEDQQGIEFHLEPLGGLNTIEFELYYDLNNYVNDDIYGIKFNHHEHANFHFSGFAIEPWMEVYNSTTYDFLCHGNFYLNDNTSMQTVLVPLTSEIINSKTVKIKYKANFSVENPEEGDYVKISLDTSYISVIRPLRPVINLQETGSTVNLFDNFTILCNYYDIGGYYPIPITKLEVFKEGGYEELPIFQGFSLVNINFSQIGLQAYHFKVSFGDDYFITDEKYVLVSKRGLSCNVEFSDRPNFLRINLTITDAANSTPIPNIMTSLTVFREGNFFNNVEFFATNQYGWASIEFYIPGFYYLWDYHVTILITETSDYFGQFYESPVFTCNNCTPTVTLDGYSNPLGQNVLEDARVQFTIDSLRTLNRTTILVDGEELLEISASQGYNDVYFLGIKGYHSYQVMTENILGESSVSESFDMNLNEANATLHSSAGINANFLVITFHVVDETGFKISVPVSIDIYDNGILVSRVTMDSSTTALTTHLYAFDVFIGHSFEIDIVVNDTRYESNSLILTNTHVAIPIAAILIESIGSCSLLGVGSVYFIRKKRYGG